MATPDRPEAPPGTAPARPFDPDRVGRRVWRVLAVLVMICLGLAAYVWRELLRAEMPPGSPDPFHVGSER